ncbi:MAG: hypothetical protein PHO00_00715 [bacterium]|nr:hypothetical protein [bacterium]
MFRVSIYDVGAEALLYQDEAACVVLPAEGGEISIMDFHRPIVSALGRGTIRIDGSKSFKIMGGIAAMDGAGLKIIAEPL